MICLLGAGASGQRVLLDSTSLPTPRDVPAEFEAFVGVVGGVEVERSWRIRNLRPDVVRQDAAPALRLNVVLFPALSVAQKLLYQHIMRPRLTSLAVALMVSVASVCYAQPATTNQTRDTPDFTVQVWGYILADFSARVWDYSDLRSELEKALHPLTVNDDPAEIRRAVRALAKRIRVARAGAKQEDIFTPSISVEFRKALILEVDANTWAAIMDDNPGEFSNQINGTYPEGKPLSTVPPNILAVLPRLPDDIQYRFLGRHLILLDTRANVILDRIPFAIQLPDCVEVACHR